MVRYLMPCRACGGIYPPNAHLLWSGKENRRITSKNAAAVKAVTSVARRAIFGNQRAGTRSTVGRTLRFLLDGSRPERKPLPTMDMWVVVYFLDGVGFVGRARKDPATRPVLNEVRVHMARTRMLQNRVPDDLHQFFKAYCAKRGVTMTDQIVSYLTWLREKETGVTDRTVEQF